MVGLRHKLVALAVLGFVAVRAQESTTAAEVVDVNEDANLNIRELIAKYGYEGETHHVTTEDGYILEMHRVSKKNVVSVSKPPVLMIHPDLGSSTDWVITGPGQAFGYVLADEGYDVWLGNIRGNSFSKKHIEYTSLNKKFWQFSWHESGVYDLPAMIDYVLNATKSEKLAYVGHSQGTTVFWVMASEKPEYQEKVNSVFALAPVAYMTYTRSPFYRVLSTFEHSIEKLTHALGLYEFLPTNDIVKMIAEKACKDGSVTQIACSNIMFLIGGFSHDQLNATMLPIIAAHAPAGGSVQQFLHYLQLIRARKFQQYDYGFVKNLLKYGKFKPPTYQLSTIKVPVHLYYSEGDRFATALDVDRLYKELGNPIEKLRVPNESFAHLDFIWGKDAKTLVYDKVLPRLAEHVKE